ncbi:MAG: hypothetical protein HY909_00365 [Deltaproteobacteria bacterium]|nr:hypothetical protein [Deltaproteobacteria bacterium]
MNHDDGAVPGEDGLAGRFLAWTSGRLVEAGTRHDREAVPGEAIPLLEEDLRDWTGGWMDPELEGLLATWRLPLRGLLGYLRQVRRALPSVDDAAVFLQRPERFGLGHHPTLEDAVRSARLWLEAREGAVAGPSPFPRWAIAGEVYAVEGLLGRGDGSDVYLARRDRRVTERVVLKVLRAPRDADLLAREASVLQALSASQVQGHEHFSTRLPQWVASGSLAREDGSRAPVHITRWQSGFVHTLEDVRAQHPRGAEPSAVLWLWKRSLELLGFIHHNGYVHGAVLPCHLLVHARDHGVRLVGWSCAVRSRPRPGHGAEALPATSEGYCDYYPRAVWEGDAPPEASLDLTMTARCMLYAAGGEPARGTVPGTVPEPLAALLRRYSNPRASGRTDDAWVLLREVEAVGRAVQGPPRYHPFAMPGW